MIPLVARNHLEENIPQITNLLLIKLPWWILKKKKLSNRKFKRPGSHSAEAIRQGRTYAESRGLLSRGMQIWSRYHFSPHSTAKQMSRWLLRVSVQLRDQFIAALRHSFYRPVTRAPETLGPRRRELWNSSRTSTGHLCAAERCFGGHGAIYDRGPLSVVLMQYLEAFCVFRQRLCRENRWELLVFNTPWRYGNFWGIWVGVGLRI